MIIDQIKITRAAALVTPYIALLYYIEVVYLVFILLILFGKTVSVIAGMIMSILLAYHIISLNYFKDRNRKIQLFLMDIHFAYSLAFIINLVMHDISIHTYDIPLLTVRSVLIAFEIPLIYYLSDIKISSQYK